MAVTLVEEPILAKRHCPLPDDVEDVQAQILSNGFGARDLGFFHASSKDH